jgi:hypothetical protein
VVASTAVSRNEFVWQRSVITVVRGIFRNRY